MTLPADSATAWASAVPVRQPGSHTRSGNAMHRTRAALLDAAEHCIARYGARRTTMGDVALKASTAKATLYNHFRTKEDLLAGLVEARVDDVARACRARVGEGVAAVLVVAAGALAANAALRRVAAEEPALASRLATGGDGRVSRQATDAVRAVLDDTVGRPVDDAAVVLVRRWLTSQLLWPCDEAAARAQADLLSAAVAGPVAGPLVPALPSPVGRP